MSQPHDRRIDLLRCLAIAGVLITHADFERFDARTHSLVHLGQHLFGWCVIAFFAIAGLLTKRETTIARYVGGRAPRLLFPFLFASIVAFVLMTAIAATNLHSLPGGHPTLHEFAWSLLMLRGFGPQLYFLPYLFLIGLVCLALVRVLPDWAALILVGLACGAAWLTLPVPRFPHGPHWFNVPFYAFAFLLGHCFRPQYDRRVSLAALAATLCVGLFTFVMTGNSYVLMISMPFVLYALLPELPAAVVGASYVGAVFLWHDPVIMPACSAILQRLGVTSLANLFGTMVGAVGLSIAVDVLLRRLPNGQFLTLTDVAQTKRTSSDSLGVTA